MRFLPVLILSTMLFFCGTLLAQDDSAIHWFEGSVEQAFSTAQQQKKPVILYWGAQWCPPCNELKATLFKQPSFISKTRLFVPVYLDGDTEQAQAQGERFNVMGYPTLIIFTADGREITRIPGGMELSRYTDVLDMALNHIDPVKQLVDKILDQNHQPTDREIRLLAYYSWQQDAGQATGDRDKMLLFRKLSQLTPKYMTEENSHFDAAYLLELANSEQPLSIESALEGMRRLTQILANPINTLSNLEFVAYECADVISKLTEHSKPAKQHMVDKWEAAIDRVAELENLTPQQLLSLHRGSVEVLKLQQKAIPPSLKYTIRADINDALSGVQNDYQRIALTSDSYSLLQASEQQKEAQKLLMQALQHADNNHYWMLILADMASEEGRADDAIDLYQQAYEHSQGLATRLQWGSYYLQGLTRLQPQDTEKIERLCNELIVALQHQESPFYGRNMRVLKKINQSLAGWAKTDAQKKLAGHFTTTVSGLCLSKNDAAQCDMLSQG